MIWRSLLLRLGFQVHGVLSIKGQQSRDSPHCHEALDPKSKKHQDFDHPKGLDHPKPIGM